MAADALSSTSITALDNFSTTGNPIVEITAGAGAPAALRELSDYVTPTTGGLVSTSSKYKMVRLPMNAKLKKLDLTSDAALDSSTGLALDVGAYYSDSTIDGTPTALQGTAISVNCFAAVLTFQSAFAGVNALGAFSVVKRNQPLWQALGLASNPGGFVDVVVAVHTAATTAVSSNLQAVAEFAH